MTEIEQNDFKHLKRATRILLVVLGTVSLILALIGIVLPILPTTPFLLLTAGCYARSSEKFYNALMNNRFFGQYIRNYRDKKKLPVKIKIYTILFLWITIGISILIIKKIIVTFILIVIALSVSTHIVLIGRKDKI